MSKIVLILVFLTLSSEFASPQPRFAKTQPRLAKLQDKLGCSLIDVFACEGEIEGHREVFCYGFSRFYSSLYNEPPHPTETSNPPLKRPFHHVP